MKPYVVLLLVFVVSYMLTCATLYRAVGLGDAVSAGVSLLVALGATAATFVKMASAPISR
ncbi:MAG: hypothetical protein HZA81_00440 [Candidatus Taylorbacteria bacterium]|nr:hypothetical protein [Candidatus Taylorbacteria bacterium]